MTEATNTPPTNTPPTGTPATGAPATGAPATKTERVGKRRRLYFLPALLVVGVAVIGLLSPGSTTQAASTSTGTGAVDAFDPPNPITYQKLPTAYLAAGEQLFEKNCASCRSSANAIFCSVSSDGTVCPFSTRDR